MQQPYVIILANGLNGLGAVRSAHHAGLRAYTILTRPSDLSTHSRFGQYRFLLPPKPSVQDIKTILDHLFVHEGRPGVLFACSDFAAELLGQLKSEGYDNHHLLVPCSETTRILNDKKLECEYMEKGGITLPKTYYDLQNDIPKSYPVIIKPRSFRDQKILGAKNTLVHSAQELAEFRKAFHGKLEHFIAQKVIHGKDDNLWVCNVTFDLNNELTACFIFNRLGTMPSHYGVTSLAVSRDNQQLREECKKIGKALKYSGPAMIEFKKDPESKNYYYIETNPRLGMCNWFDTKCGINNLLACAHAAHRNNIDFLPQRNNRVYWNFFGDLVARLENRENLLSIFYLYMSLLWRRPVGALLYWKDPRPALLYARSSIKSIVRRVGRKVRKRFNGSPAYLSGPPNG